MKQKLIIITGKQGSGKTTLANKLAEKYKWRRPYSRKEQDAEVITYPLVKMEIIEELINNLSPTIIEVQKEFLHDLLITFHEFGISLLDMTVIDLDVDLKQLNK